MMRNLWKVILVTNSPNLTLPEINLSNTKTLGFWIENRDVHRLTTNPSKTNPWGYKPKR